VATDRGVEFPGPSFTMDAMALRDPQLETIARAVVWWEPPEVTLSDQDDFLCRVMARGLWDEVKRVESAYGEEAFRQALRRARPGVIDVASWHYWHHRLGMLPVPEMPKRSFA
jgi:hypothetical protein